MRVVKRLIEFSVWLGLLAPAAVWGQMATHPLRGTVQDAQQMPIAGAVIELHELGTGVISDSLGQFVFNELRAGTYHLHYRMTGYKAGAVFVTVPQDSPLVIVLAEDPLQLEAIVIEDVNKREQESQSQTLMQVSYVFIREHTGNSLPEVLARLPGVTFANMGVGQAKPVIRGLWGNRIAVFQGGIRQEGQQWGADHGLELDQFAPGQVTVEMGPRSLAYGPEAMAGVVVIGPGALPQDSTLNVGTMAIYRSVNHNVSTSTFAEGRRRGWVGRIRFSTQDYADYRVPADTFTYNRYQLPILDNTLKNTAGRERNLSASVGLHRNWGSSTLTFSRFAQESGLFPGAVGTPRAYQLTQDNNARNLDLPSIGVQHLKALWNTRLQVAGHWLELDLGLQDNLRRERSQPDAHGYPTDTALGTEGHRLNLRTASANLRYYLKTSDVWSFTFGLSGEHQTHRFGGYEFILGNFDRQSAGAFAQAFWQPNRKLYLNGGARIDAGWLAIQAYSQALYSAGGDFRGVFERNPDIRRQYVAPSWAVGASWAMSDELRFKLNAASAFRFPQPYELAANGVHHGAFRHEQGDANLKPERGYSLDAAVVFTRPHWGVTLTPFASLYPNFIFLQPAPRFSTLPEGGQLYAYTQTDALLYGGEIRIQAQTDFGLSFGLGADYVRGQNRTDALPLTFMPPPRGLFHTTYRLYKLGPLRDIRLHCEFEYTAPQNRVARNEAPTPGYPMLNAAAGFSWPIRRFKPRFEIQAQNLTNQTYLRHLSRYRILNLPEPGRNFVVVISLPLDFKLR